MTRWLGLVLCLSVCASQARGESAEELVRGAEEKIKQKAWDDAIKDCDRALALDSKSGSAVFCRARAKHGKGDLRGALADYNLAVAAAYGGYATHHNLGLVHRALGKLQDSENAFSEAIRLDGTIPACWYWRGVVRSERNDFEKALADYGKALELNPSFEEALLDRADIRAAQGQFDAALADIRKALETNPSSALATRALGNLFLDQGKIPDALVNYRKACELKGDNSSLRLSLVGGLISAGEPDEALREVSTAIQLSPTSGWAWFRRGHARFCCLKRTDALADLRKAVEFNSNPEYAQLWIWLIRSQLGEREDATDELAAYLRNRAPSIAGDWPAEVGRYLCGTLAEEALLQSAQSPNPVLALEQLCVARYYIGAVRQLEGDHAAALKNYQEALGTHRFDWLQYQAAAFDKVRLMLAANWKPASAETRELLGLSKGGLIVTRVEPGGPAARAGLQEKDVIVRWAGSDAQPREFWQFLKDAPPGKVISMDVLRKGAEIKLEVTLGAW